MRTSLNEIQQIEEHLFKNVPEDNNLLFEAKQLLDPQLREKIWWQQNTYTVIHQYGRKKLRAEIASVQHQLFNEGLHRKFKQQILKLFHKSKE